MSRLPRAQEHLKTAFIAEAEKAALYRAFSDRAERDGQPNLAASWRQLARDKDARAVAQLEAAGRVHDAAKNLAAAAAEESYQHNLLYPKMVGEVDAQTAEVLEATREALAGDLARLERLRQAFSASPGDVASPVG